MTDPTNASPSHAWGHFKDTATEARFQRAELARNLVYGRWALIIVLLFETAQAFGGMTAVVNAWVRGVEPELGTVIFLSIRLAVLAVSVTGLLVLKHITRPISFELLSVGIFLVLSIHFFIQQTFSPDQLPQFDFVRISLFTLLIYLLMPLKTKEVMFLGVLVSLAIFFAHRFFGDETDRVTPLIPALLILLVLNAIGGGFHRLRQLNLRSNFLATELLTKKSADETEMVLRQDQFMAVLAHELRNPLAVIQAKCQLASLQQQQSLAIDISMPKDILVMLARIQSLFDGLMANAKTLTRPEHLNLIEIPARIWLKTAVEGACWESTRSIVISPQNALVKLRCDAGLLAVIVNNLCSNAEKYSDIKHPLVLSIRVRGAKVGIRVRDYGPGIPKEQHDFIFQKYARQTQHTGIEGYGFGLFMAKSLALQMHGHISLQSTLGRGSAFTVWLPRGETP